VINKLNFSLLKRLSWSQLCKLISPIQRSNSQSSPIWKLGLSLQKERDVKFPYRLQGKNNRSLSLLIWTKISSLLGSLGRRTLGAEGSSNQLRVLTSSTPIPITSQMSSLTLEFSPRMSQEESFSPHRRVVQEHTAVILLSSPKIVEESYTVCQYSQSSVRRSTWNNSNCPPTQQCPVLKIKSV